MKGSVKFVLVAFVMLIIVPLTVANAFADKVFVTVDKVAELVSTNAPKLRVIDCRADMKAYEAGHIPGAVFMNVRKKLRIAVGRYS